MPHDEYREMAQKFLDLWQDQLTASFRDPETVARNMQMMQQMGQAYFEALTPRAGQGTPSTAGGKRDDFTASAGVPTGSHELLHFAQRLEALERRITLLELALTSDAGKPKPKSKKPRA